MHQFSHFFKKGLLLFLYIFINSFYILKYGVRQDYMSVTLLVLCYAFGVVFTFFIFSKLKTFFNQMPYFHLLFGVLGVLVVGLLLAINLYVDPDSLNVLRHDGLNTTISHVLQGKYPYTTFLDLSGDTTSNLPGLFYIGLPFYLMGDVGYLQVFVFLCLFLWLYLSKLKPSDKLLLFGLLLFSPAFLWEVYVKSDLMSNLFLLAMFLYWWLTKYKDDYFQRPLLLGIFVALFALTRLITIIPFLIVFGYPFFRTSFHHKLRFVLSFLLALLFLSLPIMWSIPSWETFIAYNPLNNQTGEAPWFLSVLFLLIAFVISRKIQKSSYLFLCSTLLIFSIVLLRFLLNVFEEGWYSNVFGNLFDISYFGLSIPFLFVYIFSRKNIMHA